MGPSELACIAVFSILLISINFCF